MCGGVFAWAHAIEKGEVNLGARMDSAIQESSGTIGTGLIPMRFVWPYGGKNVSLSGSFNRWSGMIRMSPVEGCPTVFQAVVRIPPGFHQYKFSVDEQWQHDEHQPCITSDYGIVNTIFLPSEASHQPVQVNNQGIQHLLGVSANTVTDTVPTVLEAKVLASRHQISVFLSTKTAFDLLPESGKVVALDIDMPIKQAFHIFYEQGISTAPLWDFSKGQFVGVLSAMDFILILNQLGHHGSNLTEEELETHTIGAWKEGKAYIKRQVDVQGRPFSRPLVDAGPNDNLKDVALKILQNEVASLPIINSSSKDGPYPQLLHMASLSGILKCVCRYFRNCPSLLPVLQLPICAIPIGTWASQVGESNSRPLAILRPGASLSLALSLFIQAQVSSIPIVDDSDSLVDIYARSDITSLAKDKVYARMNLNEMTIYQALQLAQDSCSLYEPSQRCQMCLRSDSLHKVMERLANPGVRRLVVVEAGSRRVEGIISLSDIFKFLLC